MLTRMTPAFSAVLCPLASGRDGRTAGFTEPGTRNVVSSESSGEQLERLPSRGSDFPFSL